ncbi:hypothetical protein D3C79_1046650 [compost metagenome]
MTLVDPLYIKHRMVRLVVHVLERIGQQNAHNHSLCLPNMLFQRQGACCPLLYIGDELETHL